ncbi:MAG TPA: dTDP-4-dehydrorhamnose reductase [Anaerolineales bacterium]
MLKILLLGKNGQLGWELRRTLAPLGEVLALDYPEIDLTQAESIEQVVLDARPQIIINATAYTAVDRAESEAQIAFAINGDAPRGLARAAARLGAALIHYSTDYVFDGTKGSPYLESDLPHPLGVYGQSKLAGEQAIQQVGGNSLILRTSWVYSLRRDSFVTKTLQWARKNRSLRLVTDQVGNPTWARMLAEITGQLVARGGEQATGWLGERGGLYHLAGSGFASRMEWALAILAGDPKREEQVVQETLPALTAEFPAPAQRPLYSALDCTRFTEVFDLRLPPWQDALALAMEMG